MKSEIETFEPAAFRSSPLNLGPAPSLRIPVTARNRALLRRLRAAELSSWVDPSDSPLKPGACAPLIAPATPVSLENQQR